jgi:hypothetical protein
MRKEVVLILSTRLRMELGGAGKCNTDSNGHSYAEHYPRQFECAHVAVGARCTQVERIPGVSVDDLGSRGSAVLFVWLFFVVVGNLLLAGSRRLFLNGGLLVDGGCLFMVVVTGPVVVSKVVEVGQGRV